MSDFTIRPAGDSALLVQFPSRIDPALSSRVVMLARAVEERAGAVLRDVVVGYCTVTVYFDPVSVDSGWVESMVADAARETSTASEEPGPTLDVPVCYGGDFGPDLADVARSAECTEDEVIALHSGTTYRVYVVGFVPGFPYMAAVDPRLALPRRATPRTRVPAGSVAIAAGQTGIYPAETPGGWHLIGRTPVKPYDPSRPNPFLFKPGDRVRFQPIPRSAFDSFS